MNAPERDPRIDPRPGDVLETPWRQVRVHERTMAPPFVMFSERIKVPLGGLSGSENGWMTPRDWFEAYKHATIIQRGDS